MVREFWNDTELSAYLDGQLAPRRNAELAAALTRDAALQRRLDELRRTVALLQTYPLREAPRNYILTPAMVRGPQRQTRRRPTLLWLRMATALSTAAFVIVVGLQLVGGGGVGSLPPAAQKAMEIQEVAVELPTEAPLMMEAESLAPEEEIAFEALAVPTEAPTEAATAEPAFGSEKAAETESVPAPAGEIVEETSTPMADRAVSEGVQLTATTEMTLEALLPLPVITESIGLCSAEDGAEARDDWATGGRPPQEEPVASLPDADVEDELYLTAEGQAEEDARARGDAAWQWWATLLLGICAVGLGGATWWFSRRR